MNALINFSGHALSDKAKELLYKRFDIIEEIYVPTINLKNDVENQISNIVKNISISLNGSIPITIIVPGQATVAVLLITFLNGVLGSFPNICLLEQNDEGLFLPTGIFNINSNNLKIAGRTFRHVLWNEEFIKANKTIK